MVKSAATASKAKTPTNDLRVVGKTSYNWVDRDPVLDELCSIIQDSGKTVEWIERETTKIGRRVSRYTLINWLYGVKRPQNYGMDSVCMVLGVRRQFVHEDGTRFDVPKVNLAKVKFLRDPKPEPSQIEPAYPETPALPAPKVQPIASLKGASAAHIKVPAKAKAPAKRKQREAAE